MTRSLVLVPVDNDEASLTAVEYAAAIAAEYDAAVHALYVVGTELARAIEDGLVDDADLAAEVQAHIESIVDLVDEADVPLATSMATGFSTQRLSRHPGSVVLDTAEELGADFLVVPREAGGRTTRDDTTLDAASSDTAVRTPPDEDVLAKTAEYVLLYATQPVLSV